MFVGSMGRRFSCMPFLAFLLWLRFARFGGPWGGPRRGGGFGGWGGKVSPELRGLMDEVRQLGQFVFAQGAHGGLSDPDKVRRLRDLVRRVRSEVEAIFRGGPDSPDMV
jgi:hypothetical protein